MVSSGDVQTSQFAEIPNRTKTMLDIKIGDEVETVMGNGIITEIRSMKDGIVLLVEIQPGGFGRGYSDVFSLDEIELI